MGLKERKEKQKTEMRQAILEAAMSLFIEEGYDSVTIRKIADKIEYSPATIYFYFDDKDAIFFELHNIGFTKLYMHQIEAQNITESKERLIEHGRAYLNFAIEHKQYYDLMFISRGPGTIIKQFKNWECGNRSFDLLIKNVKECMDAGYFAGGNGEAIAFIFWSMVHGMASLSIRNRLIMYDIEGSIMSREELFECSLKVLRDFIR